MFGYATDVRSATQGRASYTMQFERYEEVPTNIEDEIVEHRSGEPGRGGVPKPRTHACWLYSPGWPQANRIPQPHT